MKVRIFCAMMTLALAACWGEADVPEAPPTIATPTASATAPGPREVSEETDTYLFEYSYPQAAGQIPGLARWLDARLQEKQSTLAAEAARGRSEARDNGFPYNPYSSSTEWEVVADLPDWLSLSAELSSYAGGAHPNYGFDTLIWDKRRNQTLEPIAFFISADELDRAIGEQLCAALNAEREERRGAPVPEGSTEAFDACVKVDETNLLLGSTGGRRFDRIGIQIAPYLAGPYAEGAYELTFPVTEELLATVRPELREAFEARN